MGTYTKLIEPENLLESVPPKVSSPLTISGTLVGSNETETRSSVMTPCANRLSVTIPGMRTPSVALILAKRPEDYSHQWGWSTACQEKECRR